jgi:hypothetical protein
MGMLARERRFAIYSLAVIALSCVAAPPLAASETEASAVARLTADVSYLASDELEGRGPGTEGLKKAADYIRDEFQRLGLTSGVDDGSYFQPFEVSLGDRVVPERTSLTLHGPEQTSVALQLDESFRPFFTGRGSQAEGHLVFAGYGISAPDAGYDDYRELDVEGKIVVVIRREPRQDDENSPFDGKKVSSHSYLVTKLKAAADRKAAGLILVNDPATVRREEKDELMPQQGPGLRGVRMPFAQITIDAFDKLLKKTPITAGDARLTTAAEIEAYIDEHLQPVSQPLADWSANMVFEFQRELTEVVNVVGVLEGEGPLAHETLVIGAHYDHLGFGGFGSRRPGVEAVHNGADDNASGTAALLELARRFAGSEQKPSRRIVFIAFSGEERGLIGSAHYVANPLFPLKDTVAMLNFDMIGNLRNSELGVHGVSSAEGWETLIDQAVKEKPLTLEKGDSVIAASDHYSFYKSKIPVMFLFTGLTDIYHTPDDDTETLNLEGLGLIVDFAEDLSWLLANAEARPKFKEVAVSSPGSPGGSMAYLGVTPDYAGTTNGLNITGVKPGSPAEKGGLKAGDIIVRIGEVEVADIEGLAEGLRKYKAGQTVDIVVKREGKEVASKVTLGEPGGN